MSEGGDRIHSGCRPERAYESLAGLFVYTDTCLCFSSCPPSQLVANDFTLERLQRVSSHDCLCYCRPWLWKGIYSFSEADELIWDHRALRRSLITSLCLTCSRLIAFLVKLMLTGWVAFSFSQVTELRFPIEMPRSCAYIFTFLCPQDFIDKILCVFNEGCHINITLAFWYAEIRIELLT